MLISGIDHLHLTAPQGEEDRARDFYGGVLGLDEATAPPALAGRGGVWFEGGNVRLHLGPDERSACYFATFRARSLEALRAALTANKIRFEEEETLEGAARLYCRDPFGNHLEFLQVDATTAAAASSVAATLWLAQPQLLDEYRVASGEIERVAVSADGQWLAVGTSVEGNQGAAASISVWRFGQTGNAEVEIEMAASVWEMAFSPNGKEFAALSEDGSLETWRVGDFESEQFAELPEGSEGLAYSEDGHLLAVGSGDRVKVFRPGLDELQTIRPGLGAISALAFDAHNMLAVSGEPTRIQLWQVRPVQLSSWEVLGHAAAAAQLRFNPSQPLLAALTEDGDVLLWDINTGPEDPQSIHAAGQANALAFSPDGSLLAFGGDDARVTLWDWQAQRAVAQVEARAVVNTLAFSPDGAQLLAGCDDGRVRVWNTR